MHHLSLLTLAAMQGDDAQFTIPLTEPPLKVRAFADQACAKELTPTIQNEELGIRHTITGSEDLEQAMFMERRFSGMFSEDQERFQEIMKLGFSQRPEDMINLSYNLDAYTIRAGSKEELGAAAIERVLTHLEGTEDMESVADEFIYAYSVKQYENMWLSKTAYDFNLARTYQGGPRFPEAYELNSLPLLVRLTTGAGRTSRYIRLGAANDSVSDALAEVGAYEIMDCTGIELNSYVSELNAFHPRMDEWPLLETLSQELEALDRRFDATNNLTKLDSIIAYERELSDGDPKAGVNPRNLDSVTGYLQCLRDLPHYDYFPDIYSSAAFGIEWAEKRGLDVHEELAEFVDYEAFGKAVLESVNGCPTNRGYVTCPDRGKLTMELEDRGQESGQLMT